MKNPESSKINISYGIRQEDLSVEVLDAVRSIYSNVTGKDIRRKERNGSIPPPVDFLLMPEAIRSNFAWGHNQVEYVSGSKISSETKLVVENPNTGGVFFGINVGTNGHSDQRGKEMKQSFDEMVESYLLSKGFHEHRYVIGNRKASSISEVVVFKREKKNSPTMKPLRKIGNNSSRFS